MTYVFYFIKIIIAFLFTGELHIKTIIDGDYTLSEIISEDFNPIYLILLTLLTAIIILVKSEVKKNKKIEMYKNCLDKSISLLQKTENITNKLDDIERNIEMRDTNESDN